MTDESTKTKLWSATAGFLQPITTANDNPWIDEKSQALVATSKDKDYKELVKSCRFFYENDALSSTTLNKLVEIGINDLVLTKGSITDNEFRIFEALKPKLKEFSEQMALEFLLSGLVVPEVEFTAVTKEQLKLYNVKKYSALTLPTMMWVRDPTSVTINSSLLGPDPSYYVEIPEDLINFINSGGKYIDGTADKVLYDRLVIAYPEFVKQIKAGKTKILLENKLIFRRKTQSYQSYPLPYLNSAIEALRHKRNLRRMDYSLASRVISAILLFRLGSDEFPVTEDDDDTFTALRDQLLFRETAGQNVERIFQLFANHTLDVKWVMPDTVALLDDAKYKDINQEIIFALGFPRILITGESERTGTSDPEFAMMSPIKTMETFRDKIEVVLQYIINETARMNKINDAPDISFRPINLTAFKDFYVALKDLYDSGNLSRTAYAETLGVKWIDEITKKEEENSILEEKGIEVNAPLPYSNAPGKVDTTTTEPKKVTKPTKKPVESTK